MKSSTGIQTVVSAALNSSAYVKTQRQTSLFSLNVHLKYIWQETDRMQCLLRKSVSMALN